MFHLLGHLKLGLSVLIELLAQLHAAPGSALDGRSAGELQDLVNLENKEY